MPARTRCSTNCGRCEGAWPHSDDGMPSRRAVPMTCVDDGEHRGVGLVEELGQVGGVPVDAEDELGEVVAADRDAVHAQADVLRQPVRDRGHLGHHPAAQPALPAQRAVVDQGPGTPPAPSGCGRTGSSVPRRATPPAPARARRAPAGRTTGRARTGSSRGSRSSGCPRRARSPRRRPARGTRCCAGPPPGRPPAAGRRPGRSCRSTRPGRSTTCSDSPRGDQRRRMPVPPSARVSSSSARSSPTPSTGSAATALGLSRRRRG